jgi:spore germination protein PB
MALYVTQTITIQKLSIGSVSNSSVVQIGTSGIIKPLTHLYNTGGFTKAAPPIGRPPSTIPSTIPPPGALVPLSPVI